MNDHTPRDMHPDHIFGSGPWKHPAKPKRGFTWLHFALIFAVIAVVVMAASYTSAETALQTFKDGQQRHYECPTAGC